MHDRDNAMSESGHLALRGFDWELDNGEALSSASPGDRLEFVRPFGGPFRVLANDGELVTLRRVLSTDADAR